MAFHSREFGHRLQIHEAVSASPDRIADPDLRCEERSTMALNDILLTVSLVIQLKSGASLGQATGFFYTRNDDLFLVTNQHVVRDDVKNIIPDTLRLHLHTDPNDISKNADFDAPLYNGAQRLWKIHATHPEADIAVLKLDKAAVTGRFVVKAWSSQAFLPKQYPLDPGVDVFIMGYPLGFYDDKHNLPIFRNAMIASSYGTPFQNLPLFLTDANLHPGTSGSPVITKPKSTWVDDKGNTSIVTGTTYYLLGVHSGTFNFSAAGQQPTPLGLGATWYAALIEDIAAQF
jgi:S1-C subfamily serine protease